MRDTYAKIHKFSHVISYFTLHQWRFQNNRVLRLWRSLSPADRSEFDFNIEDLNWEDYCNHIIRGIRVYIFKDPINTLEKARSRYRKYAAVINRLIQYNQLSSHAMRVKHIKAQ